MAKKALFEAVKQASQVQFEFAGFTVTTASDGSKVVILELVDPLARVRGSQEVQVDGRNYPVAVENVGEVKVHQKNFDGNEDFQWDEDEQIGSYSGENLVLDVAKNTQAVWLTDKPFLAAASEFRGAAQQKRFSVYTKGAASSTSSSVGAKNLQPVE